MTRLLTLAFAIVLLSASGAHAQYTNTPSVDNNTGDVIAFRFCDRVNCAVPATGPGLNDKVMRFSVPTDLTPAQAFTKLREWIGEQTALLNKYNTAANVAQLQKGQTVTGLAAPAPTGPTAKETWQVNWTALQTVDAVKQTLLRNGVAAGAIDADLNSDITTLTGLVNTYTLGFGR